MKIQLISDTHNRTSDLKINPSADLLIHSGDIANSIDDLYEQTRNLDILCKEKNVDYLYVLGNHDMYSLGRPRPYTDAYDSVYDKSKLLTRHTGPRIINGFTFIGCTLFTNFRSQHIVNQQAARVNEAIYTSCITDFHPLYGIKDSEGLPITIQHHINEYEKDLQFLNQYRNKPNTVVVTHFPMNPVLTHPMYDGNRLNPYFINDIDLTGFKYVLSGHTHQYRELEHQGCKCYINPYGYLHEHGNNGFKEELLINLEKD